MQTQKVLLADDDSSIRTVLQTALTRAGFDVRATGNAANLWKWVSEGEGDLIVTDVVMPDENAFDLIPRIKKLRPGVPIIVMSAQNTMHTAIRAAEQGAFEYLPKPFDLNELVNAAKRALRSDQKDNTERGHRTPTPSGEQLPLIGRSPAMQEVYRILARLMNTDLTVMITGESGTGKELAARALHDLGKRRNGPFVAVNMAAIPRDLIESELFGHEKGSFTGANTRGVGRFEQAEGGTLFLDEIGDMPLEAQTRLLRVLQEGEYVTVGGRQPNKTNVRIVAASNKDLKLLIESGQFREDLYFRLNVVPLRLPPLRERKQDIPELARYFLAAAVEEGLPLKTINQGAIDALARYDWPGNVRELKNVIQRSVAIYADETIEDSHINRELDDTSESGGAGFNGAMTLSDAVQMHINSYFDQYEGRLPPPGLYEQFLSEFERPLIKRCINATGGNQIRAAELLGLNRNTLRKKLRDLGIEVVRGTK